MAANIMAEQQQAALYQIVRKDTNYLRAATHVFDGDLRGLAKCLDTEPEFRALYLVPADSALPRSKAGGKGFAFPDFDAFVRMCFARGHMTMMIDEAHLLCDPRFIPTYLWESVITGRHENLHIVYIAHSPKMVHHDINRNAHQVVFWRINQPHDLEYIADWCGEDTAVRVSELREAVDNRPTGGEFIPGEYHAVKLR